MRRCFVDSGHLIALINPKDQWHLKAVSAAQFVSGYGLVATQEVLIEFLNFYSGDASLMRRLAVTSVRRWLKDRTLLIIPSNENTFSDALDLYEARPDKGYSLTDCISMNVCRELGIEEILSSDKHFEQEGFRALLQRG
jgi:uncharacterized protein